jgi:hypothetical protein
MGTCMASMVLGRQSALTTLDPKGLLGETSIQASRAPLDPPENQGRTTFLVESAAYFCSGRLPPRLSGSVDPSALRSERPGATSSRIGRAPSANTRSAWNLDTKTNSHHVSTHRSTRTSAPHRRTGVKRSAFGRLSGWQRPDADKVEGDERQQRRGDGAPASVSRTTGPLRGTRCASSFSVPYASAPGGIAGAACLRDIPLRGTSSPAGR